MANIQATINHLNIKMLTTTCIVQLKVNIPLPCT